MRLKLILFKDIPKESIIIRIRRFLTLQERLRIDRYLKEVDPDYRRFVHIFFHSGSRKTEMVRLKVSDVDLEKQVFKLLIKKGKQLREVLRPIKNNALNFWKEQLKNADPTIMFLVRILILRKQKQPQKNEQ